MICTWWCEFQGDKNETRCNREALPNDIVCQTHRDFIDWANRPDIFKSATKKTK